MEGQHAAAGLTDAAPVTFTTVSPSGVAMKCVMSAGLMSAAAGLGKVRSLFHEILIDLQQVGETMQVSLHGAV
jgi:hypothetical protein